ncbi:MAG: hypothetical protein M1383_02420 [Patescibacteria group bacterium]|nr:hypothetical protein [Patescibacteria group bacterium]
MQEEKNHNRDYCLGVRVNNPKALPHVAWEPPENLTQIFGFNLAYYNPHRDQDRPQTHPDGLEGFYRVKPPFPKNPVCEISPESIDELILLPSKPQKAMEESEKFGWEHVRGEAIKVFDFRRAMVAAA